jgi:hypothetical protein
MEGKKLPRLGGKNNNNTKNSKIDNLRLIRKKKIIAKNDGIGME